MFLSAEVSRTKSTVIKSAIFESDYHTKQQFDILYKLISVYMVLVYSLNTINICYKVH